MSMFGDTSTLPMLRNMSRSRSLSLNSQSSPSSLSSSLKSQKTKSKLSKQSWWSQKSRPLSLSSAKAGAAASMRAASAITDASNIIFFIYSSLFLCLFREPELGSGRASSRPPAPRPENSSLLFWVPSLGLLPYPIRRGGRGGLRRAYSHSSSSSALGRERPCAREKNGRDYPREKTSRVAPRAGAAQNSAWASHTR